MIRFPDDPLTRRSYYTTILVAGSVAVALRIVGVALWSVARSKGVTDNIWIEITFSILSELVLATLIAGTVLHFRRRIKIQSGHELVVSAITLYALSTLILLLLSGIVGHTLKEGRAETLLDVFYIHFVGIGVYAISITLSGFLVALAIARRQRVSRTLFTAGFLVLGIWMCSILKVLTGFFNFVAVVLGIVVALMLLTSIGRLHWLSTLPLDRKIRLLWLAMCGVFATVVLSFLLLFDSDSFVTIASDQFLRSGSVVLGVINVIGFAFFVRLFIGALTALPNSSIVDRRSNEVTSLSSLTRLVAESASVDQLLSSVTKYALNVCNAHGAWCELYEEQEVQILGAELVHPDYVRTLHANRYITRLITGSDRPVLIESLSQVSPDALDGTAIRSLIIIPLVVHHKRSGTLVMFSTVDYGFDQDDLRLLTAFADTIGVGLDQARLMEAALENERLQKEFDVARNIQSSLLPRKSPDANGCEIDAITIPAAHVGGDYFDYVTFQNGNLGVLIADVSGKGVPAALYMATLKGIVLAEMRLSAGPADLLQRINTTFSGSLERSTYISMMCVEYDAAEMNLKFARAGHTPALVRLNGHVHTVTPKGIAIGIVPPEKFNEIIEEVIVHIHEGDLCLLTTDGVNERRNAELREITFAPVSAMLESMNTTSATELIRETLKLLDEHGGGTEQHDDITIVGITFNGNSVSEKGHRMKNVVGVLV